MLKNWFRTQKSSCCDVKITEVKDAAAVAAAPSAETGEACCAPKTEPTESKTCCK